jgi:hypothetical protein
MNIYTQIISNLSFNNKYLKWYINIVLNANKRSCSRKGAIRILGYCEEHHIVPESFFKERKRKGPKGFLLEESDHQDNLVYLSAKEHFICHLLLTKMMIRKDCKIKMANCLSRMINSKDRYIISGKIYEICRKIYSENHIFKDREKLKSYWGADNPGQLETVKEKSKITKFIKYNDENYNNRNQAKETWIETYGVDNPSKSKDIKKKKKETTILNYGVDHFAKIEKICEFCGELKKDPHEKQCEKNPNRINPAFKTFTVISPDKEEFIINAGLKVFCEKHNISYGSLKLNKKSKGWILLN